MKKRLQIILNDDSWQAVDALTKEANQNFENGSINYSDAINEMIVSAKVDVKVLQLKHTNLRKSLRSLASKGEIDIDSAIKTLMEIKSITGKRIQKTQNLAKDTA